MDDNKQLINSTTTITSDFDKAYIAAAELGSIMETIDQLANGIDVLRKRVTTIAQAFVFGNPSANDDTIHIDPKGNISNDPENKLGRINETIGGLNGYNKKHHSKNDNEKNFIGTRKLFQTEYDQWKLVKVDGNGKFVNLLEKYVSPGIVRQISQDDVTFLGKGFIKPLGIITHRISNIELKRICGNSPYLVNLEKLISLFINRQYNGITSYSGFYILNDEPLDDHKCELCLFINCKDTNTFFLIDCNRLYNQYATMFVLNMRQLDPDRLTIIYENLERELITLLELCK